MKHSFETLVSVCQYIASTKLRWVKEGEENSVDEVMKVAHEFVGAMQVQKILQIWPQIVEGMSFALALLLGSRS